MGLSTWKTYSGINKGTILNCFSFTGLIPSVNLFLWKEERGVFRGAWVFFPFFFLLHFSQ